MRLIVFALTLSLAPFAIGCGDDSSSGGGSGGSGGGAAGSGGTNPALAARQALLAASDDFTFDSPPATSSDDCTVTLSPSGAGDAAQVNDAVENASSWDVICFGPGTYVMDNNIAVTNVANLTVKGTGASPADVILDYATQAGEKGFDVTTPGFWIENLTIKNTNGNGVEVKADSTAENPAVFRKLNVFWDAGSVTENGAYSVYPTRGEYAIVEFCEVQGAADAGIYIGQMVGSIVRYNNVHANVAGLEVENSLNVIVYENEVWDNTGGLFALQEDLSGGIRLENDMVLFRDNNVHDNNRANFAVPGTTVSNVPTGTGVLSFASGNVEFRNNIIENNNSTGILIVSNVVLALALGESPEFSDGYDPYPHDIYVNGNTFTGNGSSPDPFLLEAIETLGGPELTMLEDVLFDSVLPPMPEDPNICIGTSDQPSIRTLVMSDFSNDCELPELSIPLFP